MSIPGKKTMLFCSSRHEEAPSDPILSQRRNMEPAYGGRLKRQRTAALQDAVATDCAPFLPRGLGVRLSSAALANILLATVLGTLMAQAPALWAAADGNDSATNRMDGTSQTRRGRFGGSERGLYKAQITPHWFQENTRFWYRNDLRDGAKEFIVVDAEHGTRQPAFDHSKLAASLSKATGKEFKPDMLPFSEIEFVHGAKSIQFEAVENGWRCDLSTYECLAQNASGSKQKKTNSNPSAENESKSPADEEISPRADADAAGQSQDQARGLGRRGGAQAQRRNSPDNKWSAFVKDQNVFFTRKVREKIFSLPTTAKKEILMAVWNGRLIPKR